MQISVIGLGKLGACMAVAMAEKGHQVIGVDASKATVEVINEGGVPFYEPHLEEMLNRNRDRVRATTDYPTAVLNSGATFIVVPTPSEPHGGFSLEYVRAAATSIGAVLAEKREYHLVVLTSTVLPGGTASGVTAEIERASGKRSGINFGVCYSPEFIALGSVITDFLNPEFVLIGEDDERAGDELEGIYRTVISNDAPARRMAIVNAELAKVALNTFVTTKITFANMLAHMCEALPGGDIDAVTGALGLDTRIGARYLSGGLGYGGPCFPRDNRALRHWASCAGVPAELADTTDSLNRKLEEAMLAKILSLASPSVSVAVLGLAYKPRSAVLDGSGALRIANRLAQGGRRVLAHDPLSAVLAQERLDPRIELVASASEAIAEADVVVIATPDRAYARLTQEDFGPRNVTVIDCWRLLRDKLADAPGIAYHAVGLDAKRQPNEGLAPAGASSNRTEPIGGVV